MLKRLIVVAFLFITACEPASTKLPNRYIHLYLDGDDAAIGDTANQRVVVDPNVSRYRIEGSYVIGERVDAHIAPENSRRYGFFIFDTKNGKLVDGLTEEQLMSALMARKLKAQPPPESCFDWFRDELKQW